MMCNVTQHTPVLNRRKRKYALAHTGLVAMLFGLTGVLLPGYLQAATSKFTPEDAHWLNRITYGIDTQTVNEYRGLGRKGYLEAQLKPGADKLPATAQRAIDALSISSHSAYQFLADADAENRRINALPDGDEKSKARQTFNETQDRVAFESAKRHLLRAVYSSAQLKEQMTWFWINHFSVFRYKGNLRWSVADYEETAIRPNALGNFRDLVRATLRHPAMLVYLDNAQSAINKINENYARELLELHTLGVNGGYTQKDIQELARVLTGVGVVSNFQPNRVQLKTGEKVAPVVITAGAFEFNPARHDFGVKSFLGATIVGKGLDEVDDAIDVIMKNPAVAPFICRKIATYFIADDPPQSIVDRMTEAFNKSSGDITSVLRVMFNSQEFNASLGYKFKDPMHYVVSALRLAYDAPSREGKTFANLKPANNMLNSLGEGFYGHPTPDGYGPREADWASAGQMSKRFEIAKWIGSGNAGLFDPDDGSPATVTSFPQLGSRLYYDVIEPTLSKKTRTGLDHAGAQWEWNAYLLGSPEFMYH